MEKYLTVSAKNYIGEDAAPMMMNTVGAIYELCVNQVRVWGGSYKYNTHHVMITNKPDRRLANLALFNPVPRNTRTERVGSTWTLKSVGTTHVDKRGVP